MQQFKSLPEVIKHFTDQKTCIDYLEEKLWKGNPICPHCGNERVYRIKETHMFKCGNKKTCDKKFNVCTGTIYENTKLPLSTWFAAVWLLTAHKKGISSCQLARDLNITQKSAWFINHRIRVMMGDPAPQPLEFMVEVDETYVGGKFANMHSKKRKAFNDAGIDNKTAVMGFVQREGKAKLKVIGEKTFKEMVQQHVDDTAVINTDSHLSYVGLAETFAGHEAVNHSQGEYKRDIFHTNTVEGFFSIFKRGIYGIYHQISVKHLHRYCEEFSHRYNSRDVKDAERFITTIKQSKGRLKYKDLIKKV